MAAKIGTVKLVSSDREVFDVDLQTAKMSQLLSSMIDSKF